MRDLQIYDIPADPESLKRAILDLLNRFDAHDHDGVNSRSFLTVIAETISSRVLAIRKTSYTDTASGFWAGLVGDTMKLRLGSSTVYVDWNGSALSVVGGTLSGSEISGATITGGTIQTASSGLRLRMTSTSPSEYQFLDGNTKVGHLKIAENGTGGYSAEISIDQLGGVVMEVGTTIGAASEVTFFNAPFFTGSGRAAVGSVYMYGGTASEQAAGIEWSGGGVGTWTFNALSSATPARISSDIIPVTVSPATGSVYSLGDSTHYWDFAYINRPTFNDVTINDTLDVSEHTDLRSTVSIVGILTYKTTPMPRVFHGFVNSGGTAGTPFPSGWSVANTATGRYTVTHDLSSTDYSVIAIAQASTVKNITIESRNADTFVVRIANLSDTLEDNNFMFILTRTA